MAVLTSLAYARTRVRRGRTGQRPRLVAVVTAPAAGGTFNLTHANFGNFARTSQRMGSPHFAWSDYSTPPLAHDVAISATASCTEARFAWTPQRNLLVAINDNSTVVERLSSDDGLTWGAASVRFASASHPDITAGKFGMIVSLAYRAGEIVGTRQAPSGATPSAEFTLKDSTATDIAVEDSVFRLIESSSGWWWIHLRPAGAGTTRLLFSTDIDTGASESFSLTSGAVTGITGGTHPGMCHAESTGSLYAWALIGTSGWITHRHPGSTAWATPIEMLDVAGDPLEFADQPFSITGSWEGPNRLILSAVLLGEAMATDLYSSEPEGESWTAFP